MPHQVVQPAPLPDGRIYLTDARDRTLILPRAWSLTRDTAPGQTPRVNPSRQHGAVRTGPRTLGVRTGGASGLLYSAASDGEGSVWAIVWPPDAGDWTFGPAAAQLDALQEIAQEVPLSLQLGSLASRVLTLDAITVAFTEVDAERVNVNVSWEAFDPLWTTPVEESNAGVLAYGASRVVTVDGTAPTRPVITITGPVENPKVTNEATGESFEYFGALAAAQELIVDTDALTATVDGGSVLASMSDPFALGFRLVPGENTIRLDSTTGDAGVDLAWKARWY